MCINLKPVRCLIVIMAMMALIWWVLHLSWSPYLPRIIHWLTLLTWHFLKQKEEQMGGETATISAVASVMVADSWANLLATIRLLRPRNNEGEHHWTNERLSGIKRGCNTYIEKARRWHNNLQDIVSIRMQCYSTAKCWLLWLFWWQLNVMVAVETFSFSLVNNELHLKLAVRDGVLQLQDIATCIGMELQLHNLFCCLLHCRDDCRSWAAAWIWCLGRCRSVV